MKNLTLLALLAGFVLAGCTTPPPVAPRFEAGGGVVDISPPAGTALGGFRYRDPAKPRVSTGIGTRPEARAVVMQLGNSKAAVVSLDMLNISHAMTHRVQKAVQKKTGIPAGNVHITATHSHTMPSICFNRHWGDQNPAYEKSVEAAMVKAVAQGVADLSPAVLRVGSATVVNGNRNRTLRSNDVLKTDAEFAADSTDATRWLDTKLKLLAFEREGKPTLLWYNFSAHPTAFGGSTLAGAEWPGLVQEYVRAETKLSPSYLQGHIGDVAPVSATGTARAVARAITQALASATAVAVDTLRVATMPCDLPLDIAVFTNQIAAKKAAGNLDAYNKDWLEKFALPYDLTKTNLPITLAAIRIGPVALLFHPAELYSVYGLTMQRDSPLPHTFVIGYGDGYVGYLPDPLAYQRSEYAATMVPTILNYPQFTPTAARVMTQSAVELLRHIAGEDFLQKATK